MKDEEIEYCKQDNETLNNYEVFTRLIKHLNNLVDDFEYMEIELEYLKLKVKVLYAIIALLIIMSLIGG